MIFQVVSPVVKSVSVSEHTGSVLVELEPRDKTVTLDGVVIALRFREDYDLAQFVSEMVKAVMDRLQKEVS